MASKQKQKYSALLSQRPFRPAVRRFMEGQTNHSSLSCFSLLTQFVRRCNNVGWNARIQIGVHYSQRIQLSNMMPSYLQENKTPKWGRNTTTTNKGRDRRKEVERKKEGKSRGNGRVAQHKHNKCVLMHTKDIFHNRTVDKTKVVREIKERDGEQREGGRGKATLTQDKLINGVLQS